MHDEAENDEWRLREVQGLKMLDRSFGFFYEDMGFGPPVAVRAVPHETLNCYRGRLPDKLLAYWAAYGFAGYGEGCSG